jgi:antitoxin CcdA
MRQDRLMQTPETNKSNRKPTNLSLDSAVLQEAKALGINISRAAEAGITEAVKLHKQEKWLRENAKALASSNAYVEANGLPLARYRQF